MLLLWTLINTPFKLFIIIHIEIILWDNQAQELDKILIQLLPIKLNNSIIDSMSDKTLLSQQLEIFNPINSMI